MNTAELIECSDCAAACLVWSHTEDNKGADDSIMDSATVNTDVVRRGFYPYGFWKEFVAQLQLAWPTVSACFQVVT